MSKPGSPASASVGTPGSSLLRRSDVTARGLNLPALIWPIDEEVVSNIIWTLPPMISRWACALPL